MASALLIHLIIFALAITAVNCNAEGDALNAWKNSLVDPYNNLKSWDPTLSNPCTYLHITCNNNNSVVIVDLVNAGLSGPLVPKLGALRNLQYLELSHNNFNGSIPRVLGYLKNLISLDLDHNQFTGYIPYSIGYLKDLRFMRLNSNKLTGRLYIIDLVIIGNLRILNVSDNFLKGTVRTNNPEGFAITTIIQDPIVPTN